MRFSVLVPVACALLTGCNPFENKMTAACEQAIQERLKAPATYKRISITSESRDISRPEFVRYLVGGNENYSKLQIERFDSGRIKPKIHKRIITSDASNDFGVPIRAINVCSYVSPDENPAPPWISVEIDGQTSSDWIISRIRQK